MSYSFIRKRLFLLLLFIVVALIVLAPLSSNTWLPNDGDYLNHIVAIIQANLALIEGQFPLRTMPVHQSGMAYPFFQFYSPTSYFFAGCIYHWITPDKPFLAYKLAIGLAILGGGIYLYRLVFWLVKSSAAAILSSVAYLTSPYYLILVDHNGSFNEALALGLVPAVLFYTLRRFYFPKKMRTFLQVSLAWYLLATVHLITFFYTSLFVALLLTTILLKQPRYFFNIFSIGLAYAFAGLLAMWYFAPIIQLEHSMVISSTFGASSIFTLYNSSFLSLISPAFLWTTGLKNSEGIIDSISQYHPNLGLPLLIGVGICFYIIITNQKREQDQQTLWFSPLVILFVFTFILIWSPFNFWKNLPPYFMIGQYAWRLLGQLLWMGTLLFAWAIAWIDQKRITPPHILLGLFIIILSTQAWLTLPEKGRIFINMDEWIQYPFLFHLTAENYLIKESNIKVVAYDHVLLDLSGAHNLLKMNETYQFQNNIPKTLTPQFIELIANLPNMKEQTLHLFINNKEISKKVVKSGIFYWHTSFNKLTSFLRTPSLTLQIKNDIPTKNAYLNIIKIFLGGFVNPETLINVEQARSHCKQQRSVLYCDIPTTTTTKWIELPVLYYPDLLRVTLNGQLVSYSGIVNENSIIAAIKANPHSLNKIKIEFVGLQWANHVSLVAWFLWAMLLIGTMLRRKNGTSV